MLAIGTIVVLARQGGAGPFDTLYAEDGSIFLSQAIEKSFWDALTTPYAGYFHSAPRIVAESASLVPLADVPALIAVSAALLLVTLSFLVFRATTDFVPSRNRRFILAAAPALLPVAQDEVFNNVANLHWFFMYTAAWLLLWRPARWRHRVVASVVVLVAGLSDPLTILLAPIVALRVATVRAWREHAVTVAFALGVAIQGLAILFSHAQRDEFAPSASPPKLAGWYVHHVGAKAVFGAEPLESAPPLGRALLTTVAGVLLISFVVAVTRRRRPRNWVAAVTLVATSVLSYAVPAAASGVTPGRYTVVPILLLLSAVACLSEDFHRPSGRAGRILIGSVLLAVVGFWAFNYRLDTPRGAGPTWSAELPRAILACERDPAGITVIPLAPPGWAMRLPCEDVLARS